MIGLSQSWSWGDILPAFFSMAQVGKPFPDRGHPRPLRRDKHPSGGPIVQSGPSQDCLRMFWVLSGVFFVILSCVKLSFHMLPQNGGKECCGLLGLAGTKHFWKWCSACSSLLSDVAHRTDPEWESQPKQAFARQTFPLQKWKPWLSLSGLKSFVLVQYPPPKKNQFLNCLYWNKCAS